MTSKINATPPRLFTQQNIVTSSRSLGTVYQNTTGKQMFVSVSKVLAPGGIVNTFTDGNNPPTTQIDTEATDPAGTNIRLTNAFIVEPGNYYKLVTTGVITLQFWIEWT